MIFETPVAEQRFFAPEVVQTSAMDCGPAALKSLLEGFSIPVSYGRLREACQTDVDGTSINTLEDIATQLGLRAEQVMLPADHLHLTEAQALPAIVVVQRPSGLTHFLVVWSRFGNFMQVMDPATGRRWPSWQRFMNEIYIHTFPVATQDWRAWAGSEGLLSPLRRRLRDLKLSPESIERLVESALADSGWRCLGTLDAATRMTDAIVRAGGLAAGEQAGRVLERFYRLSLAGPLPSGDQVSVTFAQQTRPEGEFQIPASYWSAMPLAASEAEANDQARPERLLLRGAVLVRVLGRRERAALALPEEPQSAEGVARLPPDLQAALKEPAYRPEKEIWQALRQDGLLTPSILALALFMATLAVTVEALLFQGIIQIGQNLSLVSQRILAGLAVLAFVLAPFLLEFPLTSTVQRMGRRLEARLRIAFLEKLPRLGDRYFRSRLTSDMAQRAHDLRQLRTLPSLGVGLLRTAFQLILTTLGVIWLDPISAPFGLLGVIFFVTLSFFTRPVLEERDMRLRTHIGALSRFYLDALLGLTPIKTHGGERAMRRQHEMQLFEWVRSGREYQRAAALIESLGVILYSSFAILILGNYLLKGGQVGEILLLFYWTLSLPALGRALSDLIQQYPLQRNRMLRLLEPLSAPDEEQAWAFSEAGQPQAEAPLKGTGKPARIQIRNLYLQAGGHEILKDINLDVAPGEHLAIVGLSGAGKSSLVGLLLGWHRPSRGSLQVDGKALDGGRLQSLRRQTAWVDPAVQLWNRPLYDNLRYGVEREPDLPVGEAMQCADLYEMLERLPDGMKTILGESGGLVSGGEGQRVRLGRAMLRPGVRLVILDEPFRGLDRPRRRQLLAEARRHWSEATLMCVTHDVGETQSFPRVLVIEDGRIVEDAPPAELAARPDSRYRSLLEAEEAVRRSMWASADWRRFTIADGRLRLGAADE
ncbi:MAG: ATP-binding cassette domain-containing protein [Anaerolineales bacterium]|nr:ATP-binding cassette domain-containing protein [Anaerolineales bacterium]